MADETTKEQPLVTTEVEVIDQVDDRSIVEMTGQTIQGYVYSIKQGKRVVESLTLAGINEAANRRGGIQVKEVVYKETDHSWIATAEAIDTIPGNSRNAIKQLLPVPVIREVLNFYLKRKVDTADTKYNQFLRIGEAVVLVYNHSSYTYSKLTESVIGGSDGVS